MIRALMFYIFLLSNVWAQDDFQEQKDKLGEYADESCIAIVPIGVCPKAKHVMGPLVLLREPSFIVTTKLKSSGNLKFNEVLITDNPLSKTFHQAVCSDLPDNTTAFYSSTLDEIQWKQQFVKLDYDEGMEAEKYGHQCNDLSLGETKAQCLKSWGPLYPRTGFSITPSQPLASAISTVRAINILKYPKGKSSSLSRTNLINIKSDELQLIQPKVSSSCISIGQNPKTWDKNITSKDGRYVWFYWNWRICCI